MRAILLKVSSAAELPEHVRHDLSQSVFGDFHFSAFDDACKEQNVKIEANMSAQRMARLTRQVLWKKLSALYGQEDKGLPKLALPTGPKVVLLYNYQHWNEYSGTVTMQGISDKQVLQYNKESRDLQLVSYYEPAQALQQSKGDKVPVTLQYTLRTKQCTSPIQIGIAQQLVSEFILREFFTNEMKKATEFNVSGKSLRLHGYPRIFTTPDDPMLHGLYDVSSLEKSQIALYGRLMDSMWEDQNEIACILGAVVDTVICTSGNSNQPYNAQKSPPMLAAEEQLISTEYAFSSSFTPSDVLRKAEYAATPREGQIELPKDASVFDTFAVYLRRFQTAAGREYGARFASLVENQGVYGKYVKSMDLSPRKLLVNKAEFSELTRRFMSDAAQQGAVTLSEAESLIRKSLALHLDAIGDAPKKEGEEGQQLEYNPEQGFEKGPEISLTGVPLTESLQGLEMIKLGSLQHQQHTNLSVNAQLHQGEFFPQHVESRTSKALNATVYSISPILPENGLIPRAQDEDFLEQSLEREVQFIAQQLGIQQQAFDAFLCSLPSYREFIEAALEFPVFKEDMKASATKKQGKELIFSPDLLDQQEFSERIDLCGAKDKKALLKQGTSNPFAPLFQSPFYSVLLSLAAARIKLILEPEDPANPVESQSAVQNVSRPPSSLQDGGNKKMTISSALKKGQKEAPPARKTPSAGRTGSARPQSPMRPVLEPSDSSSMDVSTQQQGLAAGDTLDNRKYVYLHAYFSAALGVIEAPQKAAMSVSIAKQQDDKQKKAATKKLDDTQPNSQLDVHAGIAQLLAQTTNDEHLQWLSSLLVKREKSQPPLLFTGRRAANCVFLQTPAKVTAQELVEEFSKRQAQLVTLKQYRQQLEAPPLQNGEKHYRSFGDFWTLAADKTAVHALPGLFGTIRLRRSLLGTFAGAFPGSLGSWDENTDQLTMSTVLKVPSDDQQKDVPLLRPSSSQKELKKSVNLDKSTTILEQKQNGISATCCPVDAGPLGIKAAYPMEAQVTGSFCDGWQAHATKSALRLWRGVDFYSMELGGAMRLESGGQKLSLTQTGFEVQGLQLQDVFSFEPEGMTDVESPYNGVCASVLKELKKYTNFPQLQEAHDKLKDAYVVQGLYSMGRFDSGAVAVEFPRFGVSALFNRKADCVLLLTVTGETFVHSAKQEIVIKADGSFLALFGVESKYAQPRAVQAGMSPVPSQAALPSAKGKQQKTSQGTKRKTSQGTTRLDQSSEDSVKIFSSALLLYAGAGYDLSHALMEKRARFNRHQGVQSRIPFDLQRKLEPSLANPEEKRAFELADVLTLLQKDVYDLCQESYLSLPALNPDIMKSIHDKTSITRAHHELFLPSSDTVCTPLQGIYRFLLGNPEQPDTPLYPSLSTFDWAGNTMHLRLGAPSVGRISYTQQVPKAKDPKDKSKEQQFEAVQMTVHAQDCAEPLLGPQSRQTVETDLVAQIERLISEREKEMLDYLQAQKMKSPDARSDLPSPTPGKGGKATPKQLKAQQEVKQPVALLSDISARELPDILKELRKIETVTPLQLFLSSLSQEVQTYPRDSSVVLNDSRLEEFISLKLQRNLPNPARPAAVLHHVVVPLVQEIKVAQQVKRPFLENDHPYLLVSVKDTVHLKHVMQLAAHAEPGSAVLQVIEPPHGSVSASSTPVKKSGCESLGSVQLRFSGPFQNYFANQRPAMSEGFRQLLVAFRGFLDASKIRTDPQRALLRLQSFACILAGQGEMDGRFLPTLLKTSEKYRQFETKQQSKQEPSVENQIDKEDQDLFTEVAEVLQAEKRNEQREKERVRQRRMEQELENQLQKERAAQQQSARQVQEKVEDYYIDKPLKKPTSGKKPSGSNPPSQAVPKRIPVHPVDQDDDSDEELSQAALRHPSALKRHPFLKNITEQTDASSLPCVLPRLTAERKTTGIILGKLIKVVPDKVNSRNLRNAINVRNVTAQDVQIDLLFDTEMLAIEKSQLTIPAGQSQMLFLDSRVPGNGILTICAELNGESQNATVSIYE